MRRAHQAEKLKPKRGQLQDVDMSVTHEKDDSNIAAVMCIAHMNKQTLALQVNQAIQYKTTISSIHSVEGEGENLRIFPQLNVEILDILFLTQFNSVFV